MVSLHLRIGDYSVTRRLNERETLTVCPFIYNRIFGQERHSDNERHYKTKILVADYRKKCL